MSPQSRYRTIELYITREFLFSFLVAFFFFFFIFFVNQLLLLARNVMISAVSVLDVLRIMLYSIPIILSLTFPFASLSGAAMTLGNLSSSREIVAIRSSGISYWRIFRPLLLMGILLSLLSFGINDMLLPLGTIQYRSLYRELIYKIPELEIRPFTPTLLKDTLMVSRSSGSEGVEDIVMIDTSSSLEKRRVLFADSGSFTQDSFQFHNVHGVTSRDSDAFEYLRAHDMELFFDLASITFTMISLSPSEMSIRDVYAEVHQRRQRIASSRAQDQLRITEIEQKLEQRDTSPQQIVSLGQELSSLETKSYRSTTLKFYEIELFRKLALPMGCFFLLFIAFPIASFPMQHGKMIGFGVGVIASTIYWFLLFLGQSAGPTSALPSWLIMLGPNLLFSMLGGLLLLLSRR